MCWRIGQDETLIEPGILADALVIKKEEHLIFSYRAAYGGPKLIFCKVGNGGRIEKVPRIHGAVPHEFISGTMECIGS